jgi:antitoxin Phd
MEWQLAEAKNRLSEVVNRALAEGPQLVRRRNDTVVIVAWQEYEKLTGKRKAFKDFLTAKGPSLEGVDLTRDRSSMRDMKL